jgi:hypothetical protein
MKTQTFSDRLDNDTFLKLLFALVFGPVFGIIILSSLATAAQAVL